MTDDAIIQALRGALDKDPRNGALWLHLAELLVERGQGPEALQAARTASEIEASEEQALPLLLRLMREQGFQAEALLRAERALKNFSSPEIRAEYEALQGQADTPAEENASQEEPQLASVVEPPVDSEDWAKQFDWGDLHVTLDDVVGLQDVKQQIRLRMIAPTQQPEVYEAFGRSGGGGLLLYGPPGCGKTFIARATAGELGARFVSISIHEIVDKYWGESEKAVHALFEEARKNRPTVLFFDEFDALGSKRGNSSQFWKTLVDQLLQEMDGVEGRNSEILFMAATNVPWNVDPAFRRPGRFDRVLFVPPPDLEGRMKLLEIHGRRLPGFSELNLKRIGKETNLYTGADIRALCERASEAPLERSLSSGKVSPVTQADLEVALRDSHSTATEWLSMAKNYARYANDGGHYDPLMRYLKAHKKW